MQPSNTKFIDYIIGAGLHIAFHPSLFCPENLYRKGLVLKTSFFFFFIKLSALGGGV